MIGNYVSNTDKVKKLPNGCMIFNERVMLSICEWDNQCLQELKTGQGFRITEKGKTDVNQDPGVYSIHSPLYGTSYGDANEFADRYSCDCGRLQGRHYADEEVICPHCKSKVRFIDIDMTRTGWIILDKDFVIQPEFYKKIGAFISPKVFERIIMHKEEKDIVQPSGEPFAYIGIIEFRERFQEIMDFYLKKNRKVDMYIFIMANISNIFIHCIPVYSMHLRQFVIQNDDVRYSDEDKLYRRIFTNHKLLNDGFILARRVEDRKKRKKDVEYLRRENLLYKIQQDLSGIWDLSFKTIDKKEGFINSNILAGRTNYTARNVIVPDVDLRSDEIGLGYITFLETYKLELISLIRTTFDVNYNIADKMWREATMVYSEKVYQLMLYIIKEGHPILSIDRNPSKFWMAL